MKFNTQGLDEVDSGQDLYQLSGRLIFKQPPTSSTYQGIYGRCSSSQALFWLISLEGSELEVKFRTDTLNFKAVLELIAWFRDDVDEDDKSLLPGFCLIVTPYRRTFN